MAGAGGGGSGGGPLFAILLSHLLISNIKLVTVSLFRERYKYVPCDATRPAANKDTMSRPELNGLAMKDGVLRMRRPTLDPVRPSSYAAPGPRVLTNFLAIVKEREEATG